MRRHERLGTFRAGAVVLICLCLGSATQAQAPGFKVIVAATRHPDHSSMIRAAEPLIRQLGVKNNFTVDFTQDATQLDDAFLSRYQVFVQLQLAPFEFPSAAQSALQRFVGQGKGWVGIHAAGLTGTQFMDPKTLYWKWFEDFLGGVIYSPHPAFQRGTVRVEDRKHPITRNLPAEFEISDEWYEFDRSPRPGVHVLATVDESTYAPKKPMGDHPVLWCNEKHERMVYILIGHDPGVFQNSSYITLLRDSILWAGSKTPRTMGH